MVPDLQRALLPPGLLLMLVENAVVHGVEPQLHGGRIELTGRIADEQLFWQVHRSVIVNQRHIGAAVRVDEGHMHLTLRGRPETLPVSRHFQPLFKGQ